MIKTLETKKTKPICFDLGKKTLAKENTFKNKPQNSRNVELETIKVLLIEDNPIDARLVREVLAEVGIIQFELTHIERLDEAVQHLRQADFDVLLVDLFLPDAQGLNAVKRVHTEAPSLPIVVLTGANDEALALEALREGAQDYLVKGQIDARLLVRAIRYGIERQQTLLDLKQRTAQELLIKEIAQRIRQSLNLEQILGTTVTEVRQFLQADRVFIYRFNPDWSGTVVVESVVEPWRSMLGNTNKDHCFGQNYAPLYKQGRVQAVADIYTAGLSPCHIDFLVQFQVRANLVVPIVQGNTLWGLLAVNQCGGSRHWQEREQELIKQIATQTAIALQQAELYQQTRQELAERQRAEAQLKHIAFHDQLTGLPNRALYLERLEQAIQQTKRQDNHKFAVLFLDLDRFKLINDSLGHTIGDELLRAVAHRLKTCIRPGDTVARLGGDEFAILLENIKDVKDAVQVADRINQQLTLPFKLSRQEIFTTVSIGITLGTADCNQVEALLRNADTAMYRTKASGKAGATIFDPTMHNQAVSLQQLETDLRYAIEREELRLYYQPIIALETGEMTGFEALLRWQHPHRGWILPGQFIPTAEETGLIIPIGQWVLRESCRQLRKWQSTTTMPLTMSVNLSVKQFFQPGLVADISQILQESGLNAEQLKLEITESLLLENVEFAAAKLSQLKALGVKLHMDDFGTGYSSLSYLLQFPFDTLKIDRSFVKNLESSHKNVNVVSTMVILAHNLGMQVTAEGIETTAQLAQLRVLGCNYGQGYFFSKPLNSKAAKALITKNPRW